MSPGLTTFLFELVNFLILVAALGWFLFTPIRNALEARRAAEEKQIQDAKAKMAEAERARSEISEQRRELEEDRDRILKEAGAAAQKQADAILAEARAAAARERGEAIRELSGLSNVQLDRLASASAGAAAVVMEQLLARLETADLQRQLVKTACGELGRIARELRGRVIVESATVLDAESVSSLNAAMGDSGARAEYRVHPEIGAGLRIETNHGVIDLTAAGLAAYARRELEHRLVANAHASANSESEAQK